MSIKNAALCALLFAAGTVDARGWRNRGLSKVGAVRTSGFSKVADVASTGRKQNSGGRRGKQQGSGGSRPSRQNGGGQSGFRPNKGGDRASFSSLVLGEDAMNHPDRGFGGRGRGGKGDKGGKGRCPGVEVLDKIEACEEEIVLTCSLDFDFELEELKNSLEKLVAEKEEHKEVKQSEREEKHAALVKACPALVKECGLPLELPTPVEGERPNREAIKEMKEAVKCVFSTQPEEVEEPCASFLSDMQAEREAAKAEREEARENGEKPERPGQPDEETIEMLKAVRTCLQEDVKPTLEEDSICLAALSRPQKPEQPETPNPEPVDPVNPKPEPTPVPEEPQLAK